MNWRRQAIQAAVVLFLLSPLAAPQLLAFPYSGEIDGHRIYSERRIEPNLEQIVRNAEALAATSSIAFKEAHQPIFLTAGGWRWTWLSMLNRGAFAISRPITETIIVNRSDQRTDLVVNGREVGGRRSLHATLAHEMTHGAIRHHFGTTADWRYPAWVREGYCDYVAGSGSLSDSEAQKLIASHVDHPALVYWEGRKRVEQELARKGNSVDALFARAGS